MIRKKVLFFESSALWQLGDSRSFVGSTDQESSQQLRTRFSEHFFPTKLVA